VGTCDIVIEALVCIFRHRKVTRQDVPQEAHIGRALHVGGPPEGVDAAAGDADVGQQKLKYGIAPNVLGAVSRS